MSVNATPPQIIHCLLLLILWQSSLRSTINASEVLPDEQREVVRLQIFLDQKNFGPGYIDGRSGKFTQLAIETYNRSLGRIPSDIDAIRAEAQRAVTVPFAIAVVPEIADTYVDPTLSSDREKQSKRKLLPYRSMGEFMAERYHTSEDFLMQLNGRIAVLNAKVRSALIVPNVDPFEIEALASGRSYKKHDSLSHNRAVIDTVKNQVRIYRATGGLSQNLENQDGRLAERETAQEDSQETHEAEKQLVVDTFVEPPPRALIVEDDPERPEIEKNEGFVELDHELIAAFPITPGKEQFIHRGVWAVKNSIELPQWRYDKSLLETGKRGKKSLNIPSGPNNPVGVLWVGLTRSGIGLHGTDRPTTIGRSRSAGCVRLANWDIVRVPSLLRPGSIAVMK